MIELVQIDLVMHKSTFIDLNLELLTWINDNHKIYHHYDMEQILNQTISEYVHSNIDDLIYYPPEGIFYLLTFDGDYTGMGGLKKINDHEVEVKRMYVRSQFRGHGIGRILLHKLLEKANEFNYSKVRLTTSAVFMKPAHKLYESEGFSDSEPFPESEVLQIQCPREVVEDTSFMEKNLSSDFLKILPSIPREKER